MSNNNSGIFTDENGDIDPARMFRDGIFVIILMISVVVLGYFWGKARSRVITMFAFIVCMMYALIAGSYIYTYRLSLDKNLWYYVNIYASIYIFLVFGFLIAYWVWTYQFSTDRVAEEEKKEIQNAQKNDKDDKIKELEKKLEKLESKGKDKEKKDKEKN